MATTVRKNKKKDSNRAPGSKSIEEVTHRSSTALYGRSGSGKTTLSATWPKPILYLNIRDNGTDSISDVEDIDVVDIESADDFQEQILWLHKQANRGKLIYKTVILDTMTQLQQILVEEMGVNKKLSGKGKKRAGDFGTLTKQDWGQIAGDLKSVIMDIRNLPVESVFIAQERVFNLGDEEDDGVDQLMPEVGARLMPSVNSDLCASVSIIGNTFVRIKTTKKKEKGKPSKTTVEKIYCLRIGPNEVYTTKIRKPKGIQAPDYIEDPTFRKIKKIMKGKV